MSIERGSHGEHGGVNLSAWREKGLRYRLEINESHVGLMRQLEERGTNLQEDKKDELKTEPTVVYSAPVVSEPAAD